MANVKKYIDYGALNITQGGWYNSNGYISHLTPESQGGIYYTARMCQIDYVPTGHPSKICISGMASKAIEVSVLQLRSDNYLLSDLGWKPNGSEFTLGTYDKLAIGFRYQDNDDITPNDVDNKKAYYWISVEVKEWDGSQWTTTTVKEWDGSQWQ